jgi:ribosomal protein S27AE
MDYLCKEIDKADSVFGCAYFFSHKGVVRALQGKVCSIVMNKGAYAFKDNAQLQRFTTKGQTWRSTEGHQFILDFLSPEPVDAVRCFGTTQPERLLHNKFMVLCTTQDGIHTPQAVWTGSANFTALASDHHSENGILLRDPALAYEYVKCWARHYVLSEPLDDDPPKGVRPTLYYDWYGRNANMDTAASPTSKTTDEVKKEVDAVAVKMTTATLDDKEQKETDATRNPDKDLTSVGSPLTRKTLERVKTRCIACLGEHSVLPSELNRRQRCGKCYVAWTREQESSRIHKYTKGSKQ